VKKRDTDGAGQRNFAILGVQFEQQYRMQSVKHFSLYPYAVSKSLHTKTFKAYPNIYLLRWHTVLSAVQSSFTAAARFSNEWLSLHFDADRASS